ncbi:Uncharacterized membrane protein OS=Singulisphaera acidiphila (strain ATCC BAA-1392 / DSM 18658 / VKM B-2454 / MOB10) GN=Sinac_2676 PE=4 SV=1 [Gemmataceae bacterium]|nr:Uncharacterized membrane protein OS=Singulisphaera acidiphila (strain ATCC BAA-1392 / DSM 18658 / VKM B-2454 / MOB10) GN=Sinac_2676 PE=4 SV=1 [Gemmataceae bacterium]VTU02324.1 Uncharacterized membrane protein OS=Singulisphaera acidiphila (strain ATCC BAA-1392 / DSM 18658 / VKM B-2454 / MOB10) GN=Sinac_2676 PE=4 SV=1 [Gemmataceae bacterium]
MNDVFFSMRPAYPWSVEPLGLPALALVAVALVVLTVWSYTGHPSASRRRIFIVVALRMLALAVALLTALRPSVGVQETPKNPSVLLVGIDTSESMTTKDEVNNQARIDAVRRVMEKSQPILDELAAELNVTVHVYKFSTPDFSEGTSKYAPTDPADGKRSDYGTYLHKTFDRWQTERFLRGHLIVGDGADNGEAYSAVAEAARWGQKCPVTTFTVGFENVGSQPQDVAVTSVDCDPSPVPVKTDLTVTASVNAFGFVGARVAARLFIDGKPVATEEFTLDKEKDNKLKFPAKAPETKGEVKVKVVVGILKDDQIVPLRGELNGDNNQSETYLTVTKDGLRVLVIDRLRWEETRLRDALRSEKRFDVAEVIRQTDGAVTAAEEEFLDLDNQAYDVIVIGNVTPDQLTFTRGGKTINVLDKVRDAALKKGMGVIFLGGEHSFRGMPADLLPVTVPADPGAAIVEVLDGPGGRPIEQFQTVPTDEGLAKMMRLSKDQKQSLTLWEELNTTTRARPPAKLTGYNKMTRKPGATVYAWTTPAREAVPAGTSMPDAASPLLVGWQVGDGARGRVLAFGGYDSYLWEKLGQPKTRQGSEIHSRFWKQVVLWLAHQEDEEGEAFVRPATRQLKVGGEQSLRVGVRLPGGGDDPNAELTLKVVPLPEGKVEPDAAEIERARPEPVIRDKGGAKVLYRPRAKGEFFAVLTSPKKGPDGKPVTGPDGKPVLHRATAKFFAIPDVSDEMLRVNADHEFLSRLSVPNGGKALRLEDLPSYLKELKEQKDVGTKPKPKFYPDWRRSHSAGFLPAWLVLFVALLGAEWALRRLWGMV